MSTFETDKNTKTFINLFCAGLGEVKKIGLVYFLYLFFFSGLEFTLTFLTHSVFNYSRFVSGNVIYCYFTHL